MCSSDLSLTIDCDVLVADGGTRTASITGGYVALALAIQKLREKGQISSDPIRGAITAISVGLIDGKPCLDLDYAWDSRADVDMNVVMNHRNDFVEVQGTGEGGTMSRTQMDELLDLATGGIRKLRSLQTQTLRSVS